MITLSIKNIGKIDHAKVELAGITVIAGLNGTGKSTVSKSFFAALNSRKDIVAKISHEKQSRIEDVIENWLESSDCEYDGDVWAYAVADELADAVLASCKVGELLQDKHMELQLEAMLMEGCADNDITVLDMGTVCEEIKEILLTPEADYISFFVEKYYQDVFSHQVCRFGADEDSQIEYFKQEEDKEVSSRIRICENTWEFPGKRLSSQQENAVYIETKSVLDECVISLPSRRTRRPQMELSVPTRELRQCLFAQYEKSFAEKQRLDQVRDIVDSIIRDVTHGSIKLEQGQGVVFADEETQQDIKFVNLSSGLKIFAILQRLLGKYVLKEGDLLIVDEPEVNLHPQWQVFLAEIMVRIYKELGIYVLINSHSPYFIRAIEVKMAEYECAKQGRYYFMSDGKDGSICRDVTGRSEVIYDALYQPLNKL